MQASIPFDGARSKYPQLHWVPIMKDKSPPCRHPRLFAGKWVLNQFQDLLISVGEHLPGLSEVRARILCLPDSIGLRHIRRPLVLIPWMFSWGNVFVELRARGPRAHATGKRKSKGKDK